MLTQRRLSSGVRLGPPLPIRMLNALGPLVEAAGLWPRIDTEGMLRKVERKWKRNNWPAPLLRALPPRAKGFNDDAKLSLFGALVVRSQFERSATNALGFEDYIAQHPEILKEEIKRPLFVLGLPRTGTTLLQRLLSLHNGARFLPFWEVYSPFPKTQEDDGNERIAKAKRSLAILKWVGPELAKIHPMEAEDPEECYHLFRSHFLVPPGFDYAYVPSYWDWWNPAAHADVYPMHKRQLQVLQWFNRREHWVLKCPNHLSGVRQLLQTYPDARIVYTHRSPEQIIASLCSLTAVAWSMTSDKVDLREVGEFVLNMAERSQEAASLALQTMPRDQVAHVAFDDLVRDPTAKALALYERFGYPHDPHLKSKMAAWLESHPSDKHGTHRYQLSDFGLTAEEVRSRVQGSGPLAASAGA